MRAKRGRSTPAPPVDPGILELRSPALELVLRRIAELERPHVLDLGPPRRANLDALAEHSCVVWIEDLMRTVVHGPPPDAAPDATPDWDGHVRARLGFRPGAGFDVVLAWDLPSYLRAEIAAPLMSAVAGAVKADALLYATVSTASHIPEEPSQVTLLPDGRIALRSVGPGLRPNQPTTPVALERMLPGFRLLHSFLLKEERQDFVFAYRGE